MKGSGSLMPLLNKLGLTWAFLSNKTCRLAQAGSWSCTMASWRLAPCLTLLMSNTENAVWIQGAEFPESPSDMSALLRQMCTAPSCFSSSATPGCIRRLHGRYLPISPQFYTVHFCREWWTECVTVETRKCLQHHLPLENKTNHKSNFNRFNVIKNIVDIKQLQHKKKTIHKAKLLDSAECILSTQ